MKITNDEELKDVLQSLIQLRPCIVAVELMKDVIEYKGVTPDCSEVEARLRNETIAHDNLRAFIEGKIQEYVAYARKGGIND